ncbi:hypothetical protein ROZALSC1DRAFT_26413, partial [Rozella allomycis CSF55]
LKYKRGYRFYFDLLTSFCNNPKFNIEIVNANTKYADGIDSILPMSIQKYFDILMLMKDDNVLLDYKLYKLACSPLNDSFLLSKAQEMLDVQTNVLESNSQEKLYISY